MKPAQYFLAFLAAAFAGIGGCGGGGGSGSGINGANVPADIQAVFDQPRYKGALWGLRVVDAGSPDIVVQVALKAWMAGHLVPLATFSCSLSHSRLRCWKKSPTRIVIVAPTRAKL